jgi:uncharacterized protein YjbI with pentapeptide repeats
MDLSSADLSGATLKRAYCRNTVFRNAHLNKTNLNNAYLRRADFCGAHLIEAQFAGANLRHALMRDAQLKDAYLRRADLSYVDLRGADLTGAILEYTRFVDTNLDRTIVEHCCIYGISVWNVLGVPKRQANLTITPVLYVPTVADRPTITVDNLEMAQFVHLLLNNKKLRDVINTIGQKAVLILGRFIPGRKEVLDSIADKLRQLDYLPIIFDFEKSQERDFTETIKILAGLSLFVIADITNPKSNPLELQAFVPDYMIPLVPVLQDGETPFSMFISLQTMYNWVLPVIQYASKERLLSKFEEVIMEPALKKHAELINRRAQPLSTIHV